MNYKIDTAKPEDLPRILEIYAYARSFMAENGNPNQWGNSHPPVHQLQNDVKNGKLYKICRDGNIHGVFYFAVEEDPTYAVIEGSWHSDGPYGVIHRIASDGSGGILRAAVAFAQTKISYLRIDTHEDNTVMQGALQNEGFAGCGIIHITDGTPRIAYDRA